eukprot:scaffold97527_cov79-Phaeocystis_antarctica.AAC.4
MRREHHDAEARVEARLHRERLRECVVLDEQGEEAPRHALRRPLEPRRVRVVVEPQQLLVRRDEQAAACRVPHEVESSARLALRRRRVHHDTCARKDHLARCSQQTCLGVVPHDDDTIARLAARHTQKAALHRLVERAAERALLGARKLGERSHQLGLVLQDLLQLNGLLECLRYLDVGDCAVQEALEAGRIVGLNLGWEAAACRSLRSGSKAAAGLSSRVRQPRARGVPVLREAAAASGTRHGALLACSLDEVDKAPRGEAFHQAPEQRHDHRLWQRADHLLEQLRLPPEWRQLRVLLLQRAQLVTRHARKPAAALNQAARHRVRLHLATCA